MNIRRLTYRLAYLATILTTVMVGVGFFLWGFGDLHWVLSLLHILPSAFLNVFSWLVLGITYDRKDH